MEKIFASDIFKQQVFEFQKYRRSYHKKLLLSKKTVIVREPFLTTVQSLKVVLINVKPYLQNVNQLFMSV